MNERKYVLSVPQLHTRILQLHKLVRCRHAARHLASGVADYRSEATQRKVTNCMARGYFSIVVEREQEALLKLDSAIVEGDEVDLELDCNSSSLLMNKNFVAVVVDTHIET